jgi:hypothetical protein
MKQQRETKMHLWTGLTILMACTASLCLNLWLHTWWCVPISLIGMGFAAWGLHNVYETTYMEGKIAGLDVALDIIKAKGAPNDKPDAIPN